MKNATEFFFFLLVFIHPPEHLRVWIHWNSRYFHYITTFFQKEKKISILLINSQFCALINELLRTLKLKYCSFFRQKTLLFGTFSEALFHYVNFSLGLKVNLLCLFSVLVFGWIYVVNVPFSSSVLSMKLVDVSCQRVLWLASVSPQHVSTNDLLMSHLISRLLSSSQVMKSQMSPDKTGTQTPVTPAALTEISNRLRERCLTEITPS